MDNLQAADILSFQVKRDITTLYKRFLNILEDLRVDHSSMVKRLKERIPSDAHNIIESCDHFDDTKFNHLRKRVLDSGNDSIRGFEEQLKQFEINFGQQPK